MMSEAIMTADMSVLASLNAVFGNTPAAPSNDGAFRELLGAMMTPAVNAEAEIIPELTESDVETEQLQGIAAVFAALAPDDAEIPDADVFTAKGAEAFIKTLEKLLNGDAQECDIPELWKNVSDEEKSAYVKLLEIISGDIPDNGELVSVFFSDNSEEEFSEETVITVNDIVNAVVSEGLKLMADEKDADSEKEKAELEISPEAAAAYFAVAVPVRSDIQVQVSEKAVTAEAEAVSVQSVDVSGNIQNVYEIVRNAEPEDIRQFCAKLAEELDAEISVSTEAVSAEAPESNVAEMFGSNRQAFMARISKPFEAAEEIPAVQNLIGAEAVPQSIEAEVFTDIPVEAADTEGMAARIIERINSLEDYAPHNTGEISMKLSPDELGDIRVKITKTDEGMVIAFAAEKSEAAEMLGDRAAALAETLAAKGIKLREMTVTEQIVSERSENTALDYMGSDGRNSHESSSGQSRRFVFGVNGSENVSSEDVSDGQISEIYYNREAKLWVSA